MTRVGFESTIPVLERAKMVHASDRATTVTGHNLNTTINSRLLGTYVLRPVYGSILINNNWACGLN
jgi:hypothetical protein